MSEKLNADVALDNAPAQIRLLDAFNNQPMFPGDEALCVERLVLDDDSLLDLKGLCLYGLSFEGAGGSVAGGELFVIPEPATALLISIGAACSLTAERKRGRSFRPMLL